jgi:hypothetical protein
VGPKGSVSFVIPNYDANVAEGASTTTSSSIEAHGRTEAIRWHHSALRADQSLAQGDELIPTAGGPTHGEVCEREQLFLLDAIQNDVDLSEHMDAVVDSLRIVMAADLSIREKRVVEL